MYQAVIMVVQKEKNDMKKYNFLIVLIMLFLLSGCTKVKIGPEFSQLQKRTANSTASSIVLDNEVYHDIQDIRSIKNIVSNGISKNEAVKIALQNNPGLQADFQNLGIAKADLAQAGLYSNPSINSVFRLPTRDDGPGTSQTNIESVAALRLSDLWQVPLAKNVAQDLVEIVSLRIFSTILTVVEETKIAYDTCFATELYVENTKNLLTTTKDLRDEIYYRQLYGYTTDLDKNFIDAKVGMLESELKQQEADLANAYTHLKTLMGLSPSSTAIILTDTLYKKMLIPEFIILENYALAQRPEIQIAIMKIKQYKDTIRSEKSKIFRKIDIGVSYKQDFEKSFAGWGPYFDISLPIFDDNYAQIARAEFLFKQAEQELVAQRIKILDELNKPYANFKALEKEIDWYKNNILPSHFKAIEYAYKHAETMQITMATALESKVTFYETYSQFIEKNYHAVKEFTRLERAVGKSFELFFMNEIGEQQC